jgi:exodeoxyribonuclease I
MTTTPNPSAPAEAKPRVDFAVSMPMHELPSSFVFYDTETSGLSKCYDQILQIAAVRTNADLTVVDPAADSLTLRCRRLPWVMPSPSAMLLTRVTPDDLENQPLSSYEMLAEVTRQFEAWSPAIFIGHNIIRFDEELLRHGFFAALQDPYVTQLGGNMRADTLIMLHAVHLFAPGAVTIPMVPVTRTYTIDAATDAVAEPQFRPSFQLGNVARANGISFDDEEAHDALADVTATIEVAKLIRARAPDVFRMMLANASKAHVQDQLQLPWQQLDAAAKTDFITVGSTTETPVPDCSTTAKPTETSDRVEPLLLGHVFGSKCKLTPILHVGTRADNKNAAIVVDLTVDPDEWLHCDRDALSQWMAENPRAFQKVKINAFPIVAPFGIAAAHRSPVFIALCRQIVDASNTGTIRSVGAANDGVFTSDDAEAHVIEDAQSIITERMIRIMAHLTANPAARDMILNAFAARQTVYPLSAHIEENLYIGFPSTADRTLTRRMHAMSIPERVRHIPLLQDARLREHACRWVFAENPEALPAHERQRLVKWLSARIRGGGELNEQIPWLTTSKALDSIDEIFAKERENFASLPADQQTAAMQRLQQLFDYIVAIDHSAEDMSTKGIAQLGDSSTWLPSTPPIEPKRPF